MADNENIPTEGKGIGKGETNIEICCGSLRGEIRDIGVEVKDLMADSFFDAPGEMFPGQHGEMKANTMLAFRHLEDARMRLGKVMQQIQGGVSIFDRPGGGKPGAEPGK